MKRIWRASVLDALQRQSRANQHGTFTRQQLIAKELPTIAAETQTAGHPWSDAESRTSATPRYRIAGIPLSRKISTDQTCSRCRNFPGYSRRIGFGHPARPPSLHNRRRGQQRLRCLALQNYGGRCALCDVKDPDLLVASHIARWADSEDGRGDLANVIILCRPHDSLFELGYWSLDNKSTILRHTQKETSWAVRALLPQTISFRKPSSYEVTVEYLQNHRQRHGFEA
jgi:HNH endonuclease